jgi:hypothetical protein
LIFIRADCGTTDPGLSGLALEHVIQQQYAMVSFASHDPVGCQETATDSPVFRFWHEPGAMIAPVPVQSRPTVIEVIVVLPVV